MRDSLLPLQTTQANDTLRASTEQRPTKHELRAALRRKHAARSKRAGQALVNAGGYAQPKCTPQYAQSCKNVLADSGYFIALLNTKDHHYLRCKKFFATYTGQTTTTWAVFTEVCALLTHSKQRAMATDGKIRRPADGFLRCQFNRSG
jgi:hypothetical protein